MAYKPPESWYRIENRGPSTTEVYLYDEIGLFGVTASDFVADLRKQRGDLDLHINSPGGEVFDAIAIYNALKSHSGQVNVVIDGIAASSASFIAMAGDSVKIARNAQMMIHEAHAICVGNSKDMVECAALLDKCSDNIADIYSQRAGGTVEDWRTRMSSETWFSAEEAVEAGLADEVIGGSRATPKATWDLSLFRHAGRAEAPAPDFQTAETAGSFRDFGNREKARPESGFQSSRNAAPPGQVESLPDSPPDEAGFLVPDFA
ncbi:MAG TPA: head maturation protease, ClpP-related, partial [Micromonosporaceae bacterium]